MLNWILTRLNRQPADDLERARALIHAADAAGIARESARVRDTGALIPRQFEVTVDRQYILSAMGLLAGYNREAAFDMMTDHLKRGEAYAADQQEMV